jgi:hypothetical protein
MGDIHSWSEFKKAIQPPEEIPQWATWVCLKAFSLGIITGLLISIGIAVTIMVYYN